jgi:hypothetical protein
MVRSPISTMSPPTISGSTWWREGGNNV